MLVQSFHREVEKWFFNQLLYWIPTIAKADCFDCCSGVDFEQEHECSGTSRFQRYHLLAYFHNAFYVLWDTIDVDSVADNVEQLIFIALQYKGYHPAEIKQVNTVAHIRKYIKSDLCVNAVFDDLWVNHPEPIKLPAVHYQSEQGQSADDTPGRDDLVSAVDENDQGTLIVNV